MCLNVKRTRLALDDDDKIKTVKSFIVILNDYIGIDPKLAVSLVLSCCQHYSLLSLLPLVRTVILLLFFKKSDFQISVFFFLVYYL